MQEDGGIADVRNNQQQKNYGELLLMRNLFKAHFLFGQNSCLADGR